jgi:hypothetical protein
MTEAKTVLEKLGFKPGMRTRLDSVPNADAPMFALAIAAAAESPDWLIGFAPDSAGIMALTREHIPHYRRGGHLWLCYPKKSGAIKTDITRDIGWEPVFELDLLPVTQISVNDTWSALRWRYKDEIKKLTRRSPGGG